MFGFGKPKWSFEEAAHSFAKSVPTIMIRGLNAGVDREIDLYVECGADPERIRPELAALNSFCVWAGMCVALQKGTLKGEQLDRLESAYEIVVKMLVTGFQPSESGSLSYDTFWDYLEARRARYMSITQATSDRTLATSQIVSNFWDFASKGSPSDTLRQKVWLTYEQSLLNVAKILESIRLPKA